MRGLGADRKIFVIGDRGQLGRKLTATIGGTKLILASDFELDLTESSRSVGILEEVCPGVVVNCAAYTAVDDAEHNQELAYAVNAEGPKTLAGWCAGNDCHLVHISTDYVFSGDKPLFEGYSEADKTNPASAYGRSKLLGEENIRQREGLDYSILRTAWLYGAHGSNFLKTMLRLVLAAPKREFKVVNDQFGSPTSVDSLVRAIQGVIDNEAYGTFHATSHGYCSWYEFACEFFAQLGIDHRIQPCTTADYPTAARRPGNSILINKKLDEIGLDYFVNWRDDLSLFLESNGSKLVEEIKAEL